MDNELIYNPRLYWTLTTLSVLTAIVGGIMKEPNLVWFGFWFGFIATLVTNLEILLQAHQKKVELAAGRWLVAYGSCIGLAYAFAYWLA